MAFEKKGSNVYECLKLSFTPTQQFEKNMRGVHYLAHDTE